MLAVVAATDFAVRVYLPHFARLKDNFSGAYLVREIDSDDIRSKTVFMGDSVLWGYGLPEDDAALSRLEAQGLPVENLAFEGGSTANTYALLKLILSRPRRPRAVVFNVNLKEFNSADSAYQTLYPALERLAWPLLTIKERDLLKQTQIPSFDQNADIMLSEVWALYGMRSDVREALFNDVDAASAVKNALRNVSGENFRAKQIHRPTPDKFFGTYDLSPLDNSNVEVVFLRKTVSLLHAERIPAFVILTPQNHTLLHDYIDTPEYRAQLTYVAAIAKASELHVVNLDHAFSARDFIDNDHLTAAGNERLAVILSGMVAK